MKIIDAHLHLFPTADSWAEEAAQKVGHHNSIEHLRRVYGRLDIVHGVVMGNRSLAVEDHQYPADLFHYCVGLDSSLSAPLPDLAGRVEAHLRRESCCGVKLYPGYNRIWLSRSPVRPHLRPGRPVRQARGGPHGPHRRPQGPSEVLPPPALDEVAADHPRTRFVMCHFGNPFLDAAAAVVEKNPNVAADLSGLLEGRVDLARYRREQAGYLSLLRTWLAAIERWDDLMFGTDWPIVNLAEYIAFLRMVVPEARWERVFFRNANRIYGLGL